MHGGDLRHSVLVHSTFLFWHHHHLLSWGEYVEYIMFITWLLLSCYTQQCLWTRSKEKQTRQTTVPSTQNYSLRITFWLPKHFTFTVVGVGSCICHVFGGIILRIRTFTFHKSTQQIFTFGNLDKLCCFLKMISCYVLFHLSAVLGQNNNRAWRWFFILQPNHINYH